MATEFTLPELGEEVESGVVVGVLVSPGDTIDLDQPVLELETDKATIEVPSSVSGVVRDVAVKQGDEVSVGQIILTVGPEEAAGDSDATPGQAATTSTREPSDDGGKPDRAAADETPASRSAAPDEPAPARSEPSSAAPPPETSGRREADGGDAAESKTEPPRAAPSPPPAAEADAPAGRAVLSAPSVRKLAREIGIEVSAVTGTGSRGRVTADDVKAHARRLLSGPPDRAAAPAAAPALPDFSVWGEVERTPMTRVRQATAAQMTRAWVAPHVTQHDRADVTGFDAVRATLKAADADTPLTITALAVQVAAAALRAFPQFNASIDLARHEVVYKRYINIGVAVDTDRGLLVPVIRDVGDKSLRQIAREIAELAARTRARRIAPDDLQGGTFTITNLGGIAGTAFTPILNYPEVAILGLSRTRLEPVYREATLEPRRLLPLSLSYDHRLIDGADAARFLRWIADRLEQPLLLSLAAEPSGAADQG